MLQNVHCNSVVIDCHNSLEYCIGLLLCSFEFMLAPACLRAEQVWPKAAGNLCLGLVSAAAAAQ